MNALTREITGLVLAYALVRELVHKSERITKLMSDRLIVAGISENDLERLLHQLNAEKFRDFFIEMEKELTEAMRRGA